MASRCRLTLLDPDIEISSALMMAHARGIIHRDIRPANLIVNSLRQAMLRDFGMAEWTPVRDASSHGLAAGGGAHSASFDTGGLVSSSGSPEREGSTALDARADLIGVGILDAPSARLLNPSLPLELDVLIQRTLEGDREIRGFRTRMSAS
jgi:serine/threonine protein kinase